jgi:hypothetical protein
MKSDTSEQKGGSRDEEGGGMRPLLKIPES